MTGQSHVFAVFLTLVSLVSIVSMVRTRQLRVKYSMLWLTVGAAMAVLAASPSLLNSVSRLVGINYPPATLFLGTTVLLLLVAVHFSWELSRLEERTRVVAEELALLSANKLRRDTEHDSELATKLSS